MTERREIHFPWHMRVWPLLGVAILCLIMWTALHATGWTFLGSLALSAGLYAVVRAITLDAMIDVVRYIRNTSELQDD
ncbi:MAG: hypothetical protein WCZ66_05290 [Sphingomonadaceae bacterium]